MRGRRTAIAGFVAALLTPTIASAANDGARGYLSPTPVYDWTITVGAEGRYEPVFEGSNKRALLPNPIFAVRRFGTPEPFRGPRDGAGVGLIGNNVFQIGPVGELNMPRREQQDPQALQGLGNVPWALELGVFAEYWAVVDAVVPVGPQWTFSGGPRLTLATAPATGPYFSIDAAQSVASGLPIFDAKGGVRSVGAGTQARYFWTPQLATHAFLEYERLMGDAASSPLVVQRGTPDQLTIGFGATYSIDIKSPW
jgi:outer membrane protein